MGCKLDMEKLCSHLVVNICKKFSLDMNFNRISVIYKGNFFFSLLPGQNLVTRFTHQEIIIISNVTPVNQLLKNKCGTQRYVLNNLYFEILRSVAVVVTF
jgi:Na+-transporting NADH:ubiquinone oxidoreductase subunit NqrD